MTRLLRLAGWAGTMVLVLAATVDPALAHHPMGGEPMTQWWQGLLSGFGHPIIGVDHFAFIVAVGLASRLCPQSYAMPLAFIAATLAGTGIHLLALDLPLVEPAIAASVLLLGAIVVLDKQIPAAVFAAIFAVAGLFHGYAYGEAIVGQETGIVAAYLVGFAAIQYAVAVAAMLAVGWLTRPGGATAAAPRIAGGMVFGVGFVVAFEMLVDRLIG